GYTKDLDISLISLSPLNENTPNI
ncbi:hypothetical protein EVA_18846, partial [gut metagenome]